MSHDDGLSRMEALLSELGHPEEDFKVIHIAGTNGKGSTAVMISSILEEAGFSVGLFTSPHLENECERVQIWDGVHRMIDQDVFDDLKEACREAGRRIEDEHGTLTVFEIYTASAYLYICEQNPDYVVLECGLGGRLDSTNTIEKPLVSIICQIGLDHTAQLGGSIREVASEKAGIIKKGVPVVSQANDDSARDVIKRKCMEMGSEFIDASESFDEFRKYKTAMIGEHQIRNAAAAALAVKATGIEVSEDALSAGLSEAALPGRLEVIGKDPYWIIDGAHNPDAISALIETYREFAEREKVQRTLIVFGCMQDKNSARMIQLLTDGLSSADYASCAVDYSRAESPGRIAELVRGNGCECKAFDSVRDAYEYALSRNYECILVSGSIYLAGEMRGLYMRDRHKTE